MRAEAHFVEGAGTARQELWDGRTQTFGVLFSKENLIPKKFSGAEQPLRVGDNSVHAVNGRHQPGLKIDR